MFFSSCFKQPQKRILRVLSITLLVLMGMGWMSNLRGAGLMNARVYAQTTKDFSTASPTVKVISYKYAYIGDVDDYQLGSGTIIRSDGIILTNNHIIIDGNEDLLDTFEICVTFDLNEEPDCSYSASFVAQNKELDLALLKINAEDSNGNAVGKFKALDYTYQGEIETGTQITIAGYPGTGFGSITTTQGRVSGFHERNEVRYLKTDTDISGGNSGGTALDEQGNFVGVPSFVQTGLDTTGYVLDIKEATSWIEENIDGELVTNEKARSLLQKHQNIFNQADEEKSYTHETYPRFQIQAAGDWRFKNIAAKQVVLNNTIDSQQARINIIINTYPFSVNDVYLNELFEEQDRFQQYYTNYERKEIDFNGYPTHQIILTSGSYQTYIYYIPYGSCLVAISYSLDLNNIDKSKEIHEDVLNTFEILDEPVDTPEIIETYTLDEPAFSISRAEGWYIEESFIPTFNRNEILTFLREDSAKGYIQIYYKEWSAAKKELSNEEIFESQVNDYYDYYSSMSTLIAKSELTLDGLEGWSMTYSYKKGVETWKQSEVYLRDGDHYFYITYDDEDVTYDSYENDFREILLSFKDLQRSTRDKYSLGPLNYTYRDITYHRFENEINQLKGQGYLDYIGGDNFKPERRVFRAETLQILVDGYIHHKEKTDNLGEEDIEMRNELESYLEEAPDKVDFQDIPRGSRHIKYIRYAKDKSFIAGDGDANFRPYDRITLAEALSMMFKIFEVPVWKANKDSLSWYKPLMDKGYQLGVIPYELSGEPHHQITRGEFAYMLKMLLEEMEK